VRRDRPPWSWQGFVAAIVALSLGTGFTVAMVGATLQHEPISSGGAALLNTIGGGLVAVLSLWIGSQVEGAAQQRERTAHMTTSTPEQPGQRPDVPGQGEPLDPATNPDRDLTEQPQDPDADPDADDESRPVRR
jgi:hypothetical protein